MCMNYGKFDDQQEIDSKLSSMLPALASYLHAEAFRLADEVPEGPGVP